MEADIQFNEDNLFVSYFQPPTLQAMASFSIALPIAYNVTSRLPIPKVPKIWCFDNKIEFKLEELHDKLIGFPKLPGPIEEIIEQSLNQIHSELGIWYRRYFVKKYWPSPDLNSCIWFPNGQIDQKNTAEQILSNGGLSEPQKFTIMSQFCMEDEIATFCASSLPNDFGNSLDFYFDRMAFYWLRYRNDRLGEVPLRNYSSVNMVMASECNKERDWPAFVYFWNRLAAEDQIALIIDSMKDDSHRSKRCLQILSMMSPFQQRRVLSQIPEKVILFCFKNLNSSGCVLRVWQNVKNIMTVEQFDEVVLSILPKVRHLNVLIEIWKTASDHHKNHVVETSKQEILKCISILPGLSGYSWLTGSKHMIPSSKAIYFLQLILSQKDADFRRTFIFENVSRFGLQQIDPISYCKILTFCLPAPDDQLTFKKMVANSNEMKNSCDELLRMSFFDILTAKLRFYLPDEANLREYVKQWLQTQTPTLYNFWYNFVEANTWESGWPKFSSFVDQFYSDPLQATQLKKSFVSTFATQLAEDRQEDNSLKGALKVAEFVLVGDELTVFKRDFIHALLECFRSKNEIGPKYLIKNVLWCYNEDEHAIKEFQNNILPVDEVFDHYFKKFLSDRLMLYNMYATNLTFVMMTNELDEYLKWYMPNELKRKEYKMARINKPDDFDDFDVFIRGIKKWPPNEWRSCLQNIILAWCCDDDLLAIDELKSKHPEFH